MPKLKVLSGSEVVKILLQFGFGVVGQKGSHIKLCRINEGGYKQTLTIPKHKELDKGTLKAIFNQSGKYISDPELFSYFYNN